MTNSVFRPTPNRRGGSPILSVLFMSISASSPQSPHHLVGCGRAGPEPACVLYKNAEDFFTARVRSGFSRDASTMQTEDTLYFILFRTSLKTVLSLQNSCHQEEHLLRFGSPHTACTPLLRHLGICRDSTEKDSTSSQGTGPRTSIYDSYHYVITCYGMLYGAICVFIHTILLKIAFRSGWS